MSVNTKKTDAFKYINLAIVMFFIFVFQFIPPVSTLTPTGMHVLGIFIGVIYGWSVLDIVTPSILAILSMGFIEGYTLNSVVAAGFGSSIFWMIVFMMTFVMAFEKAGGTMFLATWFLTRKVLKGRPLLFVSVFLFACFLVSMLNALAGVILFFRLHYAICEKVGYEKHSKYAALMIIGIAFSAMFGSISHSLIGTPLLLAGAFQAATGVTLALTDFLKICFPFGIFLMSVYSLSMKFVFRCDFKPLVNVEVEQILDVSALKMTKELKLMFGLIVVLVVAIACSVLLPTNFKAYAILNNLSLMGIAMLLLAIMAYIKVDGKWFFTFRNYVGELPWDILFIAAVVMPLGNMLTMEGTGINEFITNVLGGLLTSLSPFAFVAAVLFLGMILTNFGNNAAICIMLMPIIFSMAANYGLDARPIYMCMIFAVHLAMLTPGACPYAALVWGSSEWISAKEIYKYVPVIMIIFYLLIITVGYAWAKFMFGV